MVVYTQVASNFAMIIPSSKIRCFFSMLQEFQTGTCRIVVEQTSLGLQNFKEDGGEPWKELNLCKVPRCCKVNPNVKAQGKCLSFKEKNIDF